MTLEYDKKDWSLVGHLATVCSCRDPSDLRRVNLQTLVCQALEMIPPEHYPIEAWHTAARYILGIYMDGSSSEIKQKSLNLLNQWSRLADAPSGLPGAVP